MLTHPKDPCHRSSTCSIQGFVTCRFWDTRSSPSR